MEQKLSNEWRLETTKDSNWDSFDLQIIQKVRSIDNDFPFIAQGDFDNDGSNDIALKVRKNRTFKLLIYNPKKDKIYWWKEDVEKAVIKTAPRAEISSFDGTKTSKMNSVGIMVEYLEISLYYIFWNGKSFEQIWVSD